VVLRPPSRVLQPRHHHPPPSQCWKNAQHEKNAKIARTLISNLLVLKLAGRVQAHRPTNNSHVGRYPALQPFTMPSDTPSPPLEARKASASVGEHFISSGEASSFFQRFSCAFLRDYEPPSFHWDQAVPGVRCRLINTALWVPRASRKHRLEIREGSVPPKLKLAAISHVGAMPLDARHAVHFNPDRASSSQTASSRAARSRRRVTQFLRSTRVPALLPSPPGSGARVGVASS